MGFFTDKIFIDIWHPVIKITMLNCSQNGKVSFIYEKKHIYTYINAHARTYHSFFYTTIYTNSPILPSTTRATIDLRDASESWFSKH